MTYAPWYLANLLRTEPGIKYPLSFFIIPPSEALVKSYGEYIDFSFTVIAEPKGVFEREYFDNGWLYIEAGLEARCSGMLIPTEPYVPGLIYPYLPLRNVEPEKAFVKVTKDNVGKEIEISQRLRIPTREEAAWIGWFAHAGGIFDLSPRVRSMYHLPAWDATRFEEVPYGSLAEVRYPLYAALNSLAFLVSRDAITKPTLDFKSLVEQAVAKIKEFLTARGLMPNVQYLESVFPAIVPAAEPFSATHSYINRGAPGPVELQLTRGTTMSTISFTADAISRFGETIDMPWDDLVLGYLSQILYPPNLSLKITKMTLEGREYKPLDIPKMLGEARSFSLPTIKAGFPTAALGQVDAPARLKPGDIFTLNFPITNTGYRGDIGVRISASDEQEVMQRVDRGVTITPKYSGEMPVAEVVRIKAIPIHLGRNKEKVLGGEKVIEIRPLNCLFHWDNVARIFGGYSERNEFTGFVAGKNVTVRGLTVTPGTGPLPFGYAGYMLTGTLGEGESAEIEYDDLYFLRIEAVKGIATARRGTLIERDTTLYEYSVVPTPSMAAHTLKSVVSLLTKTRPAIGEGQVTLPMPGEFLRAIETSLPAALPRISEVFERRE